MTINVRFTSYGTVAVECNGEVVEVPIPGGGSGGSAQQAPMPVNPPDPNTKSNIPAPQQQPTIARPPNEPTIAGIITTGDGGQLPPESFILGTDLARRAGQPLLQLRQLSLMPHDTARRMILSQRQVGGSIRQAYFIDVRVDLQKDAGAVEVARLRRLLEDTSVGIQGFRMLIDKQGQ